MNNAFKERLTGGPLQDGGRIERTWVDDQYPFDGNCWRLGSR
jgi:hypothetical protein